MTRIALRYLTCMTLIGALVTGVTAASADPVPAGPGAGGALQHFEVKAGPGQVAMVPLGEGDRTGQHIAVQVSAGVLTSAKYQAACGRVLLHGETGERIPAFAPAPSSEGGGGLARVCGQTGCTCPNVRADMIHVDRRPQFIAGDAADLTAPLDAPVLAGGDTPRPVAEDAAPGCFGWLELTVDTTGLKVGTQIVANVETYASGAPLNGPPTRVERLVAAVVAH